MRPTTIYDLSAKDFVTEADERALRTLRAVGPLMNMVYSALVEPRLSSLTGELVRKASRSWTIESIATECAATLSLDKLPAVVLGNLREATALTTGTESSAVIMVDKQLAEQLSESEMRALLGHEMGHIKSRHLMYHSVAELLERGVAFSGSLAGIGVISLPLRLALLSWHRESEFSADRAGLIAAGSLDSAVSMFMKVVGEGLDAESGLTTVLAAFRCHPQSRLRVEAMRNFAGSVAYSEVRRKIKLRNMLEDAFSGECRFCGSPKGLEELFCPSCGRAQA
ncbi:MAG: M48 family metallopeptidase [Candidatus Bathyarchaeia archaeon]